MPPSAGTALVLRAPRQMATQNGDHARPRRKPRKPKLAKVRHKISHLRKPEEMTLEQWQIALRRQFAREQKLRLKNVGDQPIFSEFEVTNPKTKRTYRVAIRSGRLGENYCSCPDFAVNALGTCKHVEFTLWRLGRQPGAKAALKAGFHPPYSEVYVRYGAKREVLFQAGTDCPENIKHLAAGYFDDQGVLCQAGYQRFHRFLQEVSASPHEVRCYGDTMALIAQVRDGATLARRVDRVFPRGIRSPAFRGLVKARLYPYQRAGALFAARAGRCLIADDMGLGKTIQAIAAVEILARTMGLERVLVVSPTSLKYQWKREIEKFASREALVVEGLLPRRAQLYAADSFYKLTNYDVIARDLDLIRRWQPELIILDEAQRIKNWKTRTARSVKQLDSEYAFVLTGTPLENRLEELFSIVEFVDRFRLGPMFRFLAEHQHTDETGRVVGYRNLSRISETLRPILIRRTKKEVLRELPERLEKRFFVPMTPEQRKHHEENREAVARIVQKWRRYGFLSEADQKRLMIFLQNMRMSCNSTYLLDKKTDYGTKADELVRLLDEMLEDREVKAVVFSQWLRMHELLAARMEKKPWQHILFHGGVPGPKRKDLIHRFKEDPNCRVFLSTDAGGVGLNLQHASAVVIVDQPWNPAVLEQRIGRVHRLGQQRPVRVVHFIAQGTIEEGMLALLGFKTAMFAGVLDGGKDEIFMGGTRLKRFMESVEKATGSIPPAMAAEPEPAADDREVPDDADEAPPERAPRRRGEPSAPQAASAAAPAAAAPAAAPSAPAQADAWAEIITAGLSFVEKLTQAFSGGAAAAGQAGAPTPGAQAASGPRAAGPAAPAAMIAQDDQTGRPYLKLPLPEPEVLQKLLDVVATLAQRR